MAFQVSPGINVTEVDLTTIVPSVATTVGGIAGFFESGPANQVVLIDSPKTLRETFGEPRSWNYKQWFSAANFLSYGRTLLVVRSVGSDAKNSKAGSSSTTFLPNPLAVTGGVQGVFCRFPGQKGDSLQIKVFGGTSESGFTSWNGTLNNLFGSAPESTDNLILAAGGNTTNDQIHIAVIDEDGLFSGTKGTVLERFSNLSVWPQARLQDGSSIYYKSVINNSSDYIVVGGDETPDSPIADLTSQLGVTWGITVSNTYKINWGDNGGYNTSSLSFLGGAGQTGSNGDLIQQVPSSTPEGYNLFEDVENVNVSLLIGGDIGSRGETFVKYLRDIAEARKDCVAFVSAENTSDSGTEESKKDACLTMKNWVGSSSYVVIDSGYKYQYDVYNDRFRWIPLNGDIAGLVARTDFTNDPWFSPAGLNRGQIRNSVKLAFNPTKTFRDVIYPKGVNPVISVPGEGTVLFGDRTALSKPSAFDRINVRRLFIVLEKAISAASKYSLFEFNDSFTRQQFRSLVEPFLRDVKARRGIFDFKVVCDESNNSPDVIDRNEFVADIYIKPTRTINFIQLNFIATRTGVSFAEVGA